MNPELDITLSQHVLLSLNRKIGRLRARCYCCEVAGGIRCGTAAVQSSWTAPTADDALPTMHMFVFLPNCSSEQPRRATEQVIFENIMRWLYSLNLRAPGSTVLLVANQCDRKETNGMEGPAIEASEADREGLVATANLVGERVRTKLADWHRQRASELLSGRQHRRGILGNSQAASVRRVAAGVSLLPQV